MIRNTLFILILLITGCSLVEEKKETPVALPEKKVPLLLFAGKPDLPKDDYEITSAAIGKVIVGKELSSLNALFDSVVDINVYKAGGLWLAKKIILENNKWIMAESVNAINTITSIETNSDQFKTANGCYIGMPFDSIVSRDSLIVLPEEKAFFLYHSGVGFKIDAPSEKLFFGSKSPNYNKINQSSIASFFIFCGDC